MFKLNRLQKTLKALQLDVEDVAAWRNPLADVYIF